MVCDKKGPEPEGILHGFSIYFVLMGKLMEQSCISNELLFNVDFMSILDIFREIKFCEILAVNLK